MAGRLIVLTNAAEGRDDEFNTWYDTIHLGEVLRLGPFTAAQRFRIGDDQMFPQTHRYVALYDFDGEPQKAIDALQNGAETMNMSDAMADPMVIICEPIGPVVTA